MLGVIMTGLLLSFGNQALLKEMWLYVMLSRDGFVMSNFGVILTVAGVKLICKLQDIPMNDFLDQGI